MTLSPHKSLLDYRLGNLFHTSAAPDVKQKSKRSKTRQSDHNTWKHQTGMNSYSKFMAKHGSTQSNLHCFIVHRAPQKYENFTPVMFKRTELPSRNAIGLWFTTNPAVRLINLHKRRLIIDNLVKIFSAADTKINAGQHRKPIFALLAWYFHYFIISCSIYHCTTR